MKFYHYILLLIVIIFSSCDFFKKTENENPIARVNDTYLYEDDIKDLITEGITKEDSILRVNNFINQWATQQLLINGAQINLSEEKQKQFNNLVKQYKNDLFTKAYLEALVKRSIDTIVLKEEALEVYNNNIETFLISYDC